MKKNDATVSSLDWITYSSYVDGPCWMKYVDDNKFLDELSIPGTHDSGTCSVDNDTEPQSSQVKCQQDYIPTQLLEGIRYFDIRLGKGDDPGIDHGDYYLLKKDAYFMHLSDVIGYFKTFLNENPTEALIMLVSRGNDEATDESVTTAFAKVLDDNPKLFYTSSRIPTLHEVRGKIVLLRRFRLAGNSVSGHTWGLDLTEWDDKIKAHSDSATMCLVQDARGFEAAGETGDKEPYCTKVYAQDKYKLTGTDKLSWVDNALKETTGRTRNKVDVADDDGAKVQVQERCWSINYTSCTGLSHGGNPFTSARVVNEHLYKSPYINPSGIEDTKSDYLEHIGIIASDFVDAALARSIYQRNYDYDTQHKQTASYYLPTRMRMTYGDSLSDASLQDGKTVGEGHFRLVDSSNVLNVAASGHAFAIEYVDVDALGNETVTRLQGFVPIDIDPRALTPHFEGLEGLKAGEDVRAKIAASLEGKLETDACTAQLEFVHDADGAPGTAMAEGETFAAGTYWVRVNGLLGDAAQNYTLASDGAASFTVAASGNAGGNGADQCRSLHMAVTSGIHAGRMAAHYCASLPSAPEPDEAQIQRIHERVYAPLDPERSIGWKEFEMTLQRILTEGAGPCRTEKKLLRAKEKLEQVQAASGLVGAKDLHDLLRLHEVHNLLTIGRCTVDAALYRQESRFGNCHFREDFPEQDDERFLGQVVVSAESDGKLKLELRRTDNPYA